MKITWNEAHQIAGEIIDYLTEQGMDLSPADHDGDVVENIANAMFMHSGQRWSHKDQAWFTPYEARIIS